MIKDWTVVQCSYSDLPNEEAHWFVDPPYNNKAGASYEFNCDGIDYKHLAEWCLERNGSVDVCEQFGADWLPFEVLKLHKSYSGKKKIEVVYRDQDYIEPQPRLF